MQILQVGEETLHLEPKTEDESLLVQMLFEHFTECFAEQPMGDRTDLAMSTFAVVKDWAHKMDDVKLIN